MKEIFIGLIAGVIGSLGMGGGTVLILLLSVYSGIEQHIAQGTNVIFFAPMAITAIIMFIKQKRINFKIAIPICIWGLIGATIGANISSKMNVGVLRKFFGGFLILIAIYQIYSSFKMYKKEKNRNNTIK